MYICFSSQKKYLFFFSVLAGGRGGRGVVFSSLSLCWVFFPFAGFACTSIDKHDFFLLLLFC